MIICITGYSGFLGNFLLKSLKKKFTIKKINLRKMPNQKGKNFNKFLDSIVESNIIINCAANLNPKTKRDFFINKDFPNILQKYIEKKKNKTFLIHISSTNVLIKDIKDTYTISKRLAEKKLKYSNVIILRLPLIYCEIDKIIQNIGQFKHIYNYLDKVFLPIYPMFYPGNLYHPVNIKKLSTFIENIILKKKTYKKIYNIVGKNKKNLWELFYSIAQTKNKKVLKIKTFYVKNIIPNFLKEYIYKQKNILSQILNIDFSKFRGKKTFL